MSEANEGRVVFERHLYPVVILRMPSSGTIPAIHAWYDDVEALLRSANEKVALVHDLRAVTITSASALHRAAVAERTLGLEKAGLDKRIGADARLVGNPLIAGAVNVVTWLTGKTSWPQATFSDEAEAIAWCRTELRAQRAIG